MTTPALLHNLPRMIVTDVESTGLDLFVHQATEVAWWDSATGHYGERVLPHTLVGADPAALEIQRYAERGIVRAPAATVDELADLYALMGGDTIDRHRKPTLVGSNSSFDVGMLCGAFHRAGFTPSPPWYYRPTDVAHIARWGLGWVDDHGHPLKLQRLTERLAVHVPEGAAHTAIGDVRTTVQVLIRLLDLIGDHAPDCLPVTGASA
ncbi:MAG: 3'-5' exonuclease [Nocardioides sp.]|nr:3'-5' exonuclease [Nocardioides sp.]